MCHHPLLIQFMFTSRRPRRPFTTTTPTWLVGLGSGDGPCNEDDEDCEGSGANFIETSKPSTKRPRTTPNSPRPVKQPPLSPKHTEKNNQDIIVDPATQRPSTRSTSPNMELYTVNMTEQPPKHHVPVITTRRTYVYAPNSTPPTPAEPDIIDTGNGQSVTLVSTKTMRVTVTLWPADLNQT